MSAADPSTGPIAIVPRPTELTTRQGAFTLTPQLRITVAQDRPDDQKVAAYLADWLRRATGFEVPIDTTATKAQLAPNTLYLRSNQSLNIDPAAAAPGELDESYQLIVEPHALTIRAQTPAGLFRATQTLKQLLPAASEQGIVNSPRAERSIPCVKVTDKPRFRWRGLLLDCCRHFMTPEFVKRYIDLLAYHKMNVLHWHLTEDQGWRLEIKQYPRLTEVGSWRGPEDQRYGGYYTQQQVRDIVSYAASRFITVIPEIEMPGHSSAAVASYPHLACTGGPFVVANRWGIFKDVYCPGNEETFDFLQNVLAETMELFPSPYIHIGGDECPKDRWRTCDDCQARIKAEGLKDEHELQSYMIRRIEKFLNSKGKRLIGWDEILEGGLAPNATVQSWRSMNGAIQASRMGHDVIVSPTSHCYLDYLYTKDPHPRYPPWMRAISLEQSYALEPVPAEMTPRQAQHVLGVEGNMWTERVPQHRVDHQVFPRLCAIAEVGWSPKSKHNWPDFDARMKQHYRRLDALGVKYYIARPVCTPQAGDFDDSLSVKITNPSGDGQIRYTLDGTEPTASSAIYTQPIRLYATTTILARTYWPSQHHSETTRFVFTKRPDIK